nr:TPA_asm: NADH dehydrogenase subunit 6 [Euschistus heros]
MNIMLSVMVLLSMMMMWMNHPLSMGLILILQTIMIAMITGFMAKSFFFSYIITIIMLSGALVLFIYMASVASNEKFNSPVKLMGASAVTFSITLITMMLYNEEININSHLKMSDTVSLIKMFNTMTAYLTMMAIMYLLLTMIVVSNIAKVNEGPLRTKI